MTSDFYYLLFPALLFIFYFIAWMAVGRDPKIGNVAPQYEPPPGISPGVARYILTGGSDGTTLAAVLAGLAAKNVVSIQPMDKRYVVRILNSATPLLPDEASLVRALFGIEPPVEPYAVSNAAMAASAAGLSTTVAQSGETDMEHQPEPHHAILDPTLPAKIKNQLDALQDTFRQNLEGIYFRHNYRFAGIGMVATFIWGLAIALTLQAQSSLFITFWLLAFTSIAGLVIGGVWTSKPTHPSVKQRVTRALLPVLFFGLPGAMIYVFALPEAHGFVLALLLSVVLNNIFFVIMRAPTDRGLAALRQLAGFREFLVRVEQDRLDRANTPAQRAELMNRFLPYAIALNVREGWGDQMAAAFSDSIVER